MSGSHFEPRWRLDLGDDGTITFDRTTQTITNISHAPPIGKWYVTGDE